MDKNDSSSLSAAEAAKHVTIWNRREHRKIAGNAAPLRRNLEKYLKKHPECEEYKGQDKDPNRAPIDPATGERVLLNEHVPIWHTLENRKVTGNAAPLRKNLETYLRKHPHCEVYSNQDKLPRRIIQAPSWPMPEPTFPVPSVDDHGVAPPSRPTPSTNVTGTAGVALDQNTGRPSSPKPVSKPRYIGASDGTPTSTPMQNPFYESARTRHAAPFNQPSAPLPIPSTSFHSSGFQSSPPIPTSPQSSPRPRTPTYHDMVSSWSNQPEWTRPNPQPFVSGIPRIPAVGPAQCSALFASCNYTPSTLDGAESGDGIPIPGSSMGDRPDAIMGTPFGGSLGGPASMDLGFLLGTTPRSMDQDADLMQFSPSNFFASGKSPMQSSPPSGSSAPQNPSTTSN